MSYQVKTRHADSYNWFSCYVLFDGEVIAERACLKSYRRAFRWAKRRINDHRKALASL